jgi:hypothetical protein
MEVYTLDSLYRRTAVVDDHISCIWTERFTAMGDFELQLNSTLKNRNLFIPGTRLAMNESYRLMVVETVEDGTDDDGRNILKVTGPSIEEILDDRVARGTLGDLTTTPKWVLTGTPGEIMRQIFHDICVTGILDAGDIISGVTEGSSLFPVDTIVEPADDITVEIDPMTVYQATKQIGDQYALGFRLVWDFNTSQLYYDVYAGSDRTSSQTTLPAVIFSPELDNLQDTKELVSISLYKNVAYVFSPVGHEIVYPLDVDPSIEGFQRRVLLVKADDITDEDGPTASARMITRGLEELAKNRNLQAFDGEISQYSQYKYGRDYHLGDLLEQRNSDGVINHMQVTEQIFVSDQQGERSYPTLTVNKLITPGSWSGWDPTLQEWFDLDADPITWSELP